MEVNADILTIISIYPTTKAIKKLPPDCTQSQDPTKGIFSKYKDIKLEYVSQSNDRSTTQSKIDPKPIFATNVKTSFESMSCVLFASVFLRFFIYFILEGSGDSDSTHS